MSLHCLEEKNGKIKVLKNYILFIFYSMSSVKNKMAWIDIKKAKTMGFFLNHQSIFRFQDFYTKLCLRMNLNYVIKYITKLFDIPFCFMQYVCKKFHKLVFALNTLYLYTVSNLHINMLLLGEHVEKRIVIMGVKIGQIFIIISNIS